MASEEPAHHYSSPPDTTNKRKYSTDDDSAAPRRPTGFSAPILPLSPDNKTAAPGSVTSDFEAAKLKAQEIAARIFNSAEAKRPKTENGGGYDSPIESYTQKPVMPSFIPQSYGGYQGSSQESKAIDIPNGKVGVIIGKGGETIKQLQAQSGAKIQVTRDMDADPTSASRKVDLTGTADQIARAEELIKDVLAEAEAGGSGAVSRRMSGPLPGANQYVTKIPNNKVGLVIGKGGETIKNMQQQSSARIQVIPLHLPPGDTSTERTLQIDGTPEQIEHAKQLVNEVISENRARNQSMGGQYSQQGYQARQQTSWAPQGSQMQQPGYGYMQQPGAYSTGQAQYNTSQPQYPGYPPQPQSGGYSTGWDQTTGAPNQTAEGGAAGYENSGYAYPQQTSGYGQQAQGYSQGGYGYGQPQANPTQGGYDQQQGYGSAASYGGAPNPTTTTTTTTEGNPGNPVPSYGGAQGDSTTTNQTPPPVQAAAATGQPGYGTSAPPQPGYGAPTSQAGYGTGYAPQSYAQYGQAAYGGQMGYGPPYGAPPATQQGYGQMPPQYNSYGGGYAQPPPAYSADTNTATTPQAPPPAGATQASPKS